jgi:hypothetical protein
LTDWLSALQVISFSPEQRDGLYCSLTCDILLSSRNGTDEGMVGCASEYWNSPFLFELSPASCTVLFGPFNVRYHRTINKKSGRWAVYEMRSSTLIEDQILATEDAVYNWQEQVCARFGGTGGY